MRVIVKLCAVLALLFWMWWVAIPLLWWAYGREILDELPQRDSAQITWGAGVAAAHIFAVVMPPVVVGCMALRELVQYSRKRSRDRAELRAELQHHQRGV